MRTSIVWVPFFLFVGLCASAWTADGSTEQTEAAKWAEEDALGAQRLGQNDTTLSAVGRIQLAPREWSADDRRAIAKVDAGVFFASRMLGRKGWVDRSAAFQVRLADPALLDWLRGNPNIKQVHVKGRLRVDGKYFLIEDCSPAQEQAVVAPAVGRSKRGGM